MYMDREAMSQSGIAVLVVHAVTGIGATDAENAVLGKITVFRYVKIWPGSRRICPKRLH